MSSNQRKKRRALAKQPRKVTPPEDDFDVDNYLEPEREATNEGFRGDLTLLTFIIFNIPLIVAVTFLSNLFLPHYWVLTGDALIVISLYYSRIYFLRWSLAYIRSRSRWVIGLNILLGMISIYAYIESGYLISTNKAKDFVGLFGRHDFSFGPQVLKYIIIAKGFIYLFYDEFLRHGMPSKKDWEELNE